MNQQKIFIMLFLFIGFIFGFKAKSIMGWYDVAILGSLFVLGSLFAVAIQSCDNIERRNLNQRSKI